MEQELAPSIAALALPSAIILLLLPPLLILGGVCGRRQYSNTSDEVLARHFSLESTSDEGIKVKVEISDVENSGQFSRKASESGSDSSDSLENRFQGPESQDVLYGVARTTNASGNGIGSDSGNSAYSNRFVAVTATQVKKEASPTTQSVQGEEEIFKSKGKSSLRRAVKSYPAFGTLADDTGSNVQHHRRVSRFRRRKSSLEGDSFYEEHKTCPTDQGRIHRDEEGSFYMPPDSYGPQRLTSFRDSSNRRTHILPAEVSVKAVQAALHEVCDKMDGYIKPGKQIMQSSIRIGVDAVVANVEVQQYAEETVLFFPDKNKKRRQLKLHEQAHLRDVMPMIAAHNDTFSHETDTAWVTLPSCIFVNKVVMLSEHLASNGMKSVHEMFDIWLQLAKVIREFHARGWYLHDLISFENVAMTSMGRPGNTVGWTLLELGSTSRERARERKDSSKSELNPRYTPPELAQAALDDPRQKVALNPTTDMWMFGMLVYQVMTGEPYWHGSLTNLDVLRVMMDPTAKLPHDERPVLPLVQEILSVLLHSDPLQRIPSTELVKRLEKDMPTAVHTVNSGPIVTEEHIVLPGLGATVQPLKPDTRSEESV